MRDDSSLILIIMIFKSFLNKSLLFADIKRYFCRFIDVAVESFGPLFFTYLATALKEMVYSRTANVANAKENLAAW